MAGFTLDGVIDRANVGDMLHITADDRLRVQTSGQIENTPPAID